jgi:hypothetical protein
MANEDEAISGAPLPTEKTLKARKNLLIQFWRFIAINFRMVKMIFKGNH